MESKNKDLASYVEKKILKRLGELAEFKKEIQSSLYLADNEEKGRDVLKQYYTYSDETYSIKFFMLNLECIQRWAKIFPLDFSDSNLQSNFVLKYQALKAAGIHFPDSEPDLFPKPLRNLNLSLVEEMIESLAQQQIRSVSTLKKDSSTDTIKSIYQNSLSLYQQFSEQIDKVMAAPSNPQNDIDKERLSKEILFLSHLQSFYNSLVYGNCTIKDFVTRLLEVSGLVESSRKIMAAKMSSLKASEHSNTINEESVTSFRNPGPSHSVRYNIGPNNNPAIKSPSIKHVNNPREQAEETQEKAQTAQHQDNRNMNRFSNNKLRFESLESLNLSPKQGLNQRLFEKITPVAIESSRVGHPEAEAEKEDIKLLSESDERLNQSKNSEDLVLQAVTNQHSKHQPDLRYSSIVKKSLNIGQVDKSSLTVQSGVGQKADMFGGAVYESRLDSKSRISTYKGGPAPSIKIIGGEDWMGNFTGSTKAFVIENPKDREAQITVYHSSKLMSNSQATLPNSKEQPNPTIAKKSSDPNQMPPLAPKQPGSSPHPNDDQFLPFRAVQTTPNPVSNDMHTTDLNEKQLLSTAEMKKPSRSRSSLFEEPKNSVQITLRPPNSVIETQDPIDQMEFVQDLVNPSLHNHDFDAGQPNNDRVSSVNSKSQNKKFFNDPFKLQPSALTLHSQMRIDQLQPRNPTIPEVSEQDSQKPEDNLQLELPPIKYTETVELQDDQQKLEDKQSDSRPTRMTGQFFQKEDSETPHQESKITDENKLIDASNQQVANTQVGYNSVSLQSLNNLPSKFIQSDIEKSQVSKHTPGKPLNRRETLDLDEEDQPANRNQSKGLLKQETFNSNLASNADGQHFTFNGSQSKPLPREVEQLNNKILGLQQELQASEQQSQKMKQQYDSKHLKMKEENDKLIQTNQSLLLKISQDEQTFQQKQRETDNLNREILRYKKTLSSHQLDTNKQPQTNADASQKDFEEAIKQLQQHHEQEKQRMHLDHKQRIELLTNQLTSAYSRSQAFRQNSLEAAPSTKELQQLKLDLQNKQQELAALHDKVNSLQSALNQSNYKAARLPKNSQDKEDEFIQMKYKFEDMLFKFNIIKKNAEQSEKREKDLRREIELYHSQLVALSEQSRVELNATAASAQISFSFADELELVRMRELESIHENKIEELIQENLELREKLLESESKSYLDSLNINEETVRSLRDENLQLKEQIFGLRGRILDLERRTLENQLSDTRNVNIKSKTALASTRNREARQEIEESIDSPDSNLFEYKQQAVGSRNLLPASSLKYSTSITDLDRKLSRGRMSLMTAQRATSELWRPTELEFVLSAAQPATSDPDYRALLEEAFETEAERRVFKEVLLQGSGFLVEDSDLAIKVEDMSMEAVGLMKVTVSIFSQTPITLQATDVSLYSFSTDISLPCSTSDNSMTITYSISMDLAAAVLPPKVSFVFESSTATSMLPLSVLAYVSFLETSLEDLLELCKEELFEREEVVSGDHQATLGLIAERFNYMVRDQDDYYLRASSIAQASAVFKLSYASHRVSVAMKYSSEDSYLSSMFSLLTFLFAN